MQIEHTAIFSRLYINLYILYLKTQNLGNIVIIYFGSIKSHPVGPSTFLPTYKIALTYLKTYLSSSYTSPDTGCPCYEGSYL